MKYSCKTCDFHWEGTVDTFDKVRIHEKTHVKKWDELNDYWFVLHSYTICTDCLYRCFQHKKTRDWKTTLTSMIDQSNCLHDAKVKMAGFKDRYECTRCHKFIVENIENTPKKWSWYFIHLIIINIKDGIMWN